MLVEDKKGSKLPHSLILEDRKNLTVTGVRDVDSFDDQVVVAYTDLGELVVKGKNLHISKLNLDNGELAFEGNIGSMIYTENKPKSLGMFSKIFR